MYARAIQGLAGLMIVLGVVMLVVTVARAGFGVGVLLGVLFIAAGTGRLLMLRRRP